MRVEVPAVEPCEPLHLFDKETSDAVVFGFLVSIESPERCVGAERLRFGLDPSFFFLPKVLVAVLDGGPHGENLDYLAHDFWVVGMPVEHSLIGPIQRPEMATDDGIGNEFGVDSRLGVAGTIDITQHHQNELFAVTQPDVVVPRRGKAYMRATCGGFGRTPSKGKMAPRRIAAQMAAIAVNVMCPWTRAPPAKTARWEATGTLSGPAHNYDDVPRNIIVEQGPRCAPERGERCDVAADEAGERGIEVEAQERIPRVAQHQDERHQRALAATDGELAEVRPVDLALLARKGSKPQICFTGAARAQLRDAVAEVVGAPV